VRVALLFGPLAHVWLPRLLSHRSGSQTVNINDYCTDEINMSESFSIEYTPLLMSTELISSNKCFHAFEFPDQLFCPVLWVSGPPCSCEGDHHGYFFVSPLIVVSSCPWSSCSWMLLRSAFSAHHEAMKHVTLAKKLKR
jgi:hypothetical protein